MARTFKPDNLLDIRMVCGSVILESRIVPDPTRTGWSRFENRSHYRGLYGGFRVGPWQPGLSFGPTPDAVTLEA